MLADCVTDKGLLSMEHKSKCRGVVLLSSQTKRYIWNKILPASEVSQFKDLAQGRWLAVGDFLSMLENQCAAAQSGSRCCGLKTS